MGCGVNLATNPLLDMDVELRGHQAENFRSACFETSVATERFPMLRMSHSPNEENATPNEQLRTLSF